MYEDSQEIDGRIEQVNKEERRIIRQTGTRVLQRLMGRKFRQIYRNIAQNYILEFFGTI